MVRRQTRTIVVIKAVLIAAAMIAWASIPAFATPPDNRPPDNRPPNGQEQPITQSQETVVTAESKAYAAASADSTAYGGQGGSGGEGGSATATGGAASASNEGVTVGGDSYSNESNNTNLVLVPNNNTSGCMRVYGISFGNGEGAGALGVPFRDAACDYELAADDAAATGQHEIAWYWRCHKKNIYKPFKQKNQTAQQAIMECFQEMRAMLPAVSAVESEYDAMYAQVSKEEYEEQRELIEDRIEQQDNLIQSLKDEQASKDAEIERLKREAAKLRADQKESEQSDAARRAAALKALEKKEGG